MVLPSPAVPWHLHYFCDVSPPFAASAAQTEFLSLLLVVCDYRQISAQQTEIWETFFIT